MPGLKLARLEDRTPVKLVLALTPQLFADLQLYARLYREVYGVEETISDLIPSMLASFLTGDREFMRARTAEK